MANFNSDGVEIHYKDEGSGPPILLIHGFGSSIYINWEYTGWFDLLVESKRRVIAIDNRGHGKSEKLYDPGDYGAPIMAEDARRLLDHLEIDRADVMGYSMGARIAAFLCINHADRVNRAIWAGLGYNMVRGFGNSDTIAEALEADSVEELSDESGKQYREFADKFGSDRLALAACIRSSRKKILPEQVEAVPNPILVAVGTKDDIAGSAADLAALMQCGKVLDIPGRDHMLAVGDKVFKQGVIEYLENER